MSWFNFGFASAEKYDGSTGKVTDVRIDVKTEKDGGVKHVLVNESRANPHENHTHYYEKSNKSWDTHKKGKG